MRINPATGNTYSPITPLIAAREISTVAKFETAAVAARHLNLELNDREAKIMLPYGASDAGNLKNCIRELLNQSVVISGKYHGESRGYDNPTNNNL